MWVECQCPTEKHYIKSTTWKNNTTKKRNISDSAYCLLKPIAHEGYNKSQSTAETGVKIPG